MVNRGGGVSTAGTGRPNTSSTYGGGSGNTSVNGGSGGGGGGNGGKGNGCSGCEPNVPYVVTLIDFLKILDSLKSAIEQFYPSDSVGSPIAARVTCRGRMDIRYFARIEWVKQYKETYGKFDPTNPTYVNQLKDVFLSLGADWQIDTWLREWKPPVTDDDDCPCGHETRATEP